MSVQVSYKKQTLLGFIGLLILFLSIEAIANVWWMTQINCEFEENEIFEQMDDVQKRQLCVDLYEIKTSGTELIPNQQRDSISINSLGFRGDDFSAEKPLEVYRIFMLGGSTMFGHGATSDQTTIPGYVQKQFENNYKNFNVEVINSGVQGADSFNELELIKTRLLSYAPDMVVVYDGWNDLRAENSPEEIRDNWKSICDLGVENNFDVIIALQPIAGFGKKPLTEQELIYSTTGTNYNNVPLINSQDDYNNYAKNLEELSSCSQNLDLRGVFDDQTSPLYWDQGHVSDAGNSIVADALYANLLPLLPKDIQSSSSYDKKITDESSIFERNLKYVISSYKTPLMIGTIFSLDHISLPSDTEQTSNIPKNLIFETQSKEYETESISIIVEVSNNEDNPQKTLKFKTIKNSDNSLIPHVTYFVKIYENDELLLSDFFYTETELLVFDVLPNNSDSVDITATRKYDHNAIIADPESSVKISGPILKNNVTYDFNIELRTIYDPSNWVFTLDNFYAEIRS